MPPDIVDSESSGDIISQEGSDIKLRCRARGSPRPTVTWKREDGERINVNKSLTGEWWVMGDEWWVMVVGDW